MRLSEKALLAHLSDPDSLDDLAREGYGIELVRETIPTDFVRRMVAWALERFFTDGRSVAPSREAIMETWGDLLERHEVELPPEDVEIDTIGYVIADLRSNYARVQAEKLVTDFANQMGTVDPPERVQTFGEFADRFYLSYQALITRRNEADGYTGLVDAATRLVERMQEGHVREGIHLGVDMIDDHIHLVHPGEIAALCSEPGVGKSWMAGLSLFKNWRMGKKMMLITMENDLEMTYDRIACMATGIPYDQFQAGVVADSQLRAIFMLIDEMESSPNKFMISQIDPVQRTATGLIRRAQLEGVDGIILDQLSFIRAERESKATQRNFQVSEIMKRLHELINEPAMKMAVLLLVQINRDGAKAARKEGRYRKDHLAESGAVEQFVSFLWALYQSADMAIANIVEFQNLKSRRVPPLHIQADWMPHVGHVVGQQEIDLSHRGARGSGD